MSRIKSNQLRGILYGLIAAFAVGALTGCGSGSQSSGAAINQASTGRVSMIVVWPPRTRLIPEASRSIRATLTSGTTTLGTQLLIRPTTGSSTTVAFENVPSGSATLSATAYPNADGSGTAQAAGSTTFQVRGGQTNRISVTMASTISYLAITPAILLIEPSTVQQLNATARDAKGNTVLLSTGSLTWNSTAPAIATVSSTGLVSALTPGKVRIFVTESDSRITQVIDLTVTASGGIQGTIQ